MVVCSESWWHLVKNVDCTTTKWRLCGPVLCCVCWFFFFRFHQFLMCISIGWWWFIHKSLSISMSAIPRFLRNFLFVFLVYMCKIIIHNREHLFGWVVWYWWLIVWLLLLLLLLLYVIDLMLHCYSSPSNLIQTNFLARARWLVQLPFSFNNCNLWPDQLAVDQLGVARPLDRQPLDLDLSLSFPTFCHKLCLLSVQKRPGKQIKCARLNATIQCLTLGCINLQSPLTLTLTFSLADVSKNSTPNWSASCFPRSNEMTRSSSISHLLPTKITCALSHE